MTDLLPIVFAKGQNESVDPRVISPDQHVSAQNVRWRKDGRPAKRYGMVGITTTGLDSGGTQYTTQPVNAVTAWNATPVLALGSGVRQFLNGAWTSATDALSNEISHWGPGEHDPIARSDLVTLGNASIGYANTYTVYAWDDGTNTYISVRLAAGGVVIPVRLIAVGLQPRCVGVGNLVYILYRVGTNIQCGTFDTTTLTITATNTVGVLVAAGDFFDASPRASDWLFAYRAAGGLTAKLMTGATNPTATQTQIVAAIGGGSKLAINSNATSAVFVAWNDGGTVVFAVYNNGLSALVASATVVDTDAQTVDPPSLIVTSNTNAYITFGGYIAASQSSYLKACSITSIGGTSAVVKSFGVRAASKLFNGPAVSALGTRDAGYQWVHSHNSDASNAGTKWDDQRTFYLMWLDGSGISLFKRQMHTPGMVGSTGAFTSHLSDVVSTPSGYFTALTNTLRFGNAAAEDYGIDSVSAHSIFESLRYAARATVMAGRALQFAGGCLAELNGYCEETGFSSEPVIQSITGGGGGSLTGGSNYIYVAVFEWLDNSGRRHRSSPSTQFLFASGANSSASLVVKCLIAQSRIGSVSIHIYRTVAGGQTFHRVTPNVGAPTAYAGTASITYVDLMSDTNAATQEFVYTDGGVVPNQMPPPSTFMTVCNGRLWLGGQLERCVVTASKLLVEGEPSQFGDSEGDFEFDVFLPEKCTGLASLDGTVVAFARESIYLVNGDGPDDQGNGSFNPPQKLPTDTGCIDWRSILETSIGVFYQSKRGFFLLPRGFNTPLFIGAGVESTLVQRPICQGAALVSIPATAPGFLGEITARFVMAADETLGAATVTLVFDLRTMGWSVDLSGLGLSGPAGVWNDRFTQPSNTPTQLWNETVGIYGDNSAFFVNTTLATGDVRPFGVAGYGGFESVVLVGEYAGNSNVLIAVSVDGVAADTYTFVVTSADAPDGSVYLDVTPKIRMGSAISVSIQDTDSGSGATQGFIPQALFIEHETIGKTKRLAQARRL